MIKSPKISHEPEADVLRMEVSKEPIDYAKEIGNFIVHFSKNGQPVYFEILQATKFQKVTAKALSQPATTVSFRY